MMTPLDFKYADLNRTMDAHVDPETGQILSLTQFALLDGQVGLSSENGGLRSCEGKPPHGHVLLLLFEVYQH